MQCNRNALYVSVVKCLQGDFFFSLCCGKRQKDNETGISFWCWDVRGKEVISPVTEETVYSEGQGPPLREGAESYVLYLCAEWNALPSVLQGK